LGSPAKQKILRFENQRINQPHQFVQTYLRMTGSGFMLPGFDFLMLKKLEPMIQLNSQEITEATELHPVTTCEQGGREDGKTGGL